MDLLRGWVAFGYVLLVALVVCFVVLLIKMRPLYCIPGTHPAIVLEQCAKVQR